MTLSTTSQREALRNLIAATDYLAATMLSGDPDKIRFAKDKVWQFVDEGKAALSSSTVQQVGAEWISTSERLPELGQSVALINVDRWENTGGDLEMNVRACGYLHEMRPGDPYWSIRGERANCLDAFTHWLPLPSPKSEQGDQQ